MKPAWVTGLGLWTLGFSGPDQWLAGEPDPEITKPACSLIHSRQRRGTSLVTRMGLEVMGQAATHGEADLSTAGMVFGSALGEFRTAFDQMHMMEQPDGRLSPTRFKNSVHNTATGLLSIAFKNRGFNTALAAGEATFSMCLLEALLVLDQQGGEVVIGVADDSLTGPLCKGPEFQPLGLALCLAAKAPEAGVLGSITDFGKGSTLMDTTISEDFRSNPAAAGLPLFEAVLRNRHGRVPLELDCATPNSIEILPPETRK